MSLTTWEYSMTHDRAGETQEHSETYLLLAEQLSQ